ncbi:unnamed protein product [Haemonchus placei]|uniref:Uncharacterized protein n=1 Tax=Haemonchus placei TaxID=6290 RepID=A0A0N4X375_HAEPC|nr:unnamed protein product [Haemonchus placei]
MSDNASNVGQLEQFQGYSPGTSTSHSRNFNDIITDESITDQPATFGPTNSFTQVGIPNNGSDYKNGTVNGPKQVNEPRNSREFKKSVSIAPTEIINERVSAKNDFHRTFFFSISILKTKHFHGKVASNSTRRLLSVPNFNPNCIGISITLEEFTATEWRNIDRGQTSFCPPTNINTLIHRSIFTATTYILTFPGGY